jgi:hypothetical protein
MGKMIEQVKNAVVDEETAWDLIEGVAAFFEGANILASASRLYYDAMRMEDDDIMPNPQFILHGFDEGSSKYTRKYMGGRSAKSFGGSAVGLVGSLASQITQVDVAGILQHSIATGSTAAHICQLRGISSSYRKSKTINEWLDTLIKMKALKAGIRGTQLAGAAIPVGAVGIATGIGSAIVKFGVKLTMTKVCLATASEIHWRAYQEQVISSSLNLGGGKVGPASRIMYEIFTKRGFTRIFGKYDIDRLIKEPGGWMALNDKLMLI